MVDILPGAYTDRHHLFARFCIDEALHYTLNMCRGSKSGLYLSHKSYWLAGHDPWIYIAPNELNRW